MVLENTQASGKMDVSIIIVNWNTVALLRDCLSSVFNYVPGTLKYEVFVIDNASADGSAEMVEEAFPGVLLIKNNENVGFARANNQGAAIAKGNYLLLLNSDTVVLDNGIAEIIRHLDNHRDIGVATGRVLNPDMSFQRPFSRFPHYIDSFSLHTIRLIVGWKSPFYRRFRLEALDEKKPHDVDSVSGAYLFVRSELVENGKVLDESIFMYYEDTLLCYLIRKRGYRVVYLPYAPIVHYGGMSSSGIRPKAVYNSFKGSVAYFSKVRSEVAARRYSRAVIVAWRIFAIFFNLLRRVIPYRKFREKAELFNYLVEMCASEKLLEQ